MSTLLDSTLKNNKKKKGTVITLKVSDLGRLRYLAQDENGEWYGFVNPPEQLNSKSAWVPTDGICMFVGKGELKEDWHTYYYEITS